MSNDNEDDPLAGILGDELGEWDKMFDSLHETAEESSVSDVLAVAAKVDPPTPVVAIDVASIDPPTPIGGDAMEIALSKSARVEAVPTPLPPSPFEEGLDGFTLGPPGAGTAEYPSDDELSFGGVPEALGTLLGSDGHDEIELEVRSPEDTRSPGLHDVALADVLGEELVDAEQELARISESANAFFDDGPSEAPAFSLDDDFYEGIEVGTSAIPTPIPEDEPMESIPDFSGTSVVPTPESPQRLQREIGTPVRGVVIPAAAKGPSFAGESDGIPEQIAEMGHGALRTGEMRAESEDSIELASEVDGALESIRTGPSTPPPSAAPAVVDEPKDDETKGDEPKNDESASSPRIDGVVDAAFDEAVAMSTGTLHTGPELLDADVEPDLPPSKFSDALPDLDLSRIHVADRVDADSSNRTEEVARLLVMYERELAILDEPGPTIRMRIESGRLAESLGDLDRARRHLDEALKLDPRLVPANRALRRIERRLGNWDQVLSQLDNEIQKAGAMESRALSAYRADLLRAMGEPDLARVAVGELLDSAPKDTRALLANLELAFVDGREEEVRTTLASLAETLSGARLRSEIYEVAAMTAERDGDSDAASKNFGEASRVHENLGAKLALSTIEGGAGASEETQPAIEASEKNSEMSVAFTWLAAEAALAQDDIEAASRILSRDSGAAAHPLLLGCSLRASNDEKHAVQAWQQVAAGSAGAYQTWALGQAARAAQRANDDSAVSLAEETLVSNPGSGFSQMWLRRLGGTPQVATALDVASASVSQAFGQAQLLQRTGDYSGASVVVAAKLASNQVDAPALVPYALELAHAKGDRAEQSRLYHAIAEDAPSEELSNFANRAAARALTRIATDSDSDASQELLMQAAEAWRVLALSEPGVAGEIARYVAQRSQDESCIVESATIALEHAKHAGRKSQIAIESACSNLVGDASQSAEALATRLLEAPDDRVSELFWSVALGTDRVDEAAAAFESEIASASDESVRLDRNRYRAAFVRVQDDQELDLAVQSLSAVVANQSAFGAAGELLAIALGHGGAGAVTADSALGRGKAPAQSLPQDSISTAIRQIEALANSGAIGEAADRSADLRTKYPEDALVQHSFSRFAWLAGASADLAEQALADLRLAEERSDGEAKAKACEELARIDLELRGDRESALMFWESASNAAPSRADLHRTLEGEYRGSDAHLEQRRVMLGRVIASLESSGERSAYLVARARLSKAMGRDTDTVRADYQGALADDALCREALFFLESEASAAGPTESLAGLEATVAQYFSEDPRARGAFLVRSAETWRSLGQHEQCLARLKAALQVVPGFAPALSAWRDLALDHGLWDELAEACLLEAVSADSDAARSSLFLLAGVTLMDKVSDSEGAISALRSVLLVEPKEREAFVRLRQLYLANDADEALAQLLSMRLEAGSEDDSEAGELHLSLARVLRGSNDSEALLHYRALLARRPNDREAVSAVAEICWAQEKWADAAEALMILARIESEKTELISIFTKLGTIYAEHLPEPRWALKSFHRVVGLEPGNREALGRIAELGADCGEYRLALGACEQLIKQEPPVAERIEILLRMASILGEHAQDSTNAERALRHALDLDPSSDVALDALVLFYVGQKDLRSARVHVDRVANAMRKRIRESALDAEAYRVLARAMAAKASAGAAECMPIAQVAASLAMQLGVKNAETAALAKQTGPGMGTGLASETFDDVLFPRDASGSARTLFALLGGRLAKHIGIDIRHHGVGRSDRLRKGIDTAAGIILELAAEMGVEDVDIYVSKKKPNLVAVEPTSPFSLILGEEVANAERLSELRFFVGRSLKGASASLSAPLQLGEERFGVLLVGLLRLFQPDFVPIGVDADAASAEQQRLKRLIPSSLLQELQPYAVGLVTSDFDHKVIWRGMANACNRAGLLCAGDGSAAISGLMRNKGHRSLNEAVQEPEIAALILFACSDEHGRLWAAMRA